MSLPASTSASKSWNRASVVPAGTVTGEADAPHWALLALCAVLISPLGYLLPGWLGALADMAAAALFLAA